MSDVKRRLTGTVVSDKADQTIIVSVERQKMHPIYRKRYRVTKRLAVHDPKNAHKVGDEVSITETRPRSARKRYIVETTS